VQSLKNVVDVMHNTSRQIIEKKKGALASNDKAVIAEMMEKKDIITILSKSSNPGFFVSTDALSVRANFEADEENRLRDEEVYGQVCTLRFQSRFQH
jgi:hypothetical protein